MEENKLQGMTVPFEEDRRSSTSIELIERKEDGKEGYFLGKASCVSPTTSIGNNLVAETISKVRITEVAPVGGIIIDSTDSVDLKWKMSIDRFSSKKLGADSVSCQPSKRIRSYYKAQDDLITSYEDIQLEADDALDDAEKQKKLLHMSSLLSIISFIANFILLVAKIVAVAKSGSISIISSLVDSCMDLSSGILMWWSTRAMKRRNRYHYPQGRTKLEPVSIIILSVLMTVASLLLIKESIMKIISYIDDLNGTLPNFDLVTIIITCSTVAIKFVLFIICYRVKTPSCQALAQDHRNDVLSNIVAIICGYIGSEQMRDKTQVYGLAFVDPIGAILISLYIAVNWWKTGYKQIKLLTGHTAKPEFLNKITWLCINHHQELKFIDTVRAFHFGNNFLVEVDIVLPEDMTLKKAHDIGEELQQKLEKFPQVERAFVHLDYEYDHDPNMEHKVV